jgi:hypothetical protein
MASQKGILEKLMKQHITQDQFEELSAAKSVKLHKLWRKEGQELGLWGPRDINIGTMIEFLDIRPSGVIPVDAVANSNEPCDTLWEAVKEKLAQP